ncbi:MAG: hypothetical protein ABSD88_16765 [Candidatus Korobacteraceae bacterium]|jgi:hypothetical protein
MKTKLAVTEQKETEVYLQSVEATRRLIELFKREFGGDWRAAFMSTVRITVSE